MRTIYKCIYTHTYSLSLSLINGHSELEPISADTESQSPINLTPIYMSLGLRRKLENPERALQTQGEHPPHRKAALTVSTTATPWCQNNENHLTLSVFEERLISTDWTCYWSCLDSQSLPAVPHSWHQSQSTLFWCVELLRSNSSRTSSDICSM